MNWNRAAALLTLGVLLLTGCTQKEMDRAEEKLGEMSRQAYGGSKSGYSDRSTEPGRVEGRMEHEMPDYFETGRYRTDFRGKVRSQPGTEKIDLGKNARDIVDGVQENAEKIKDGVERTVQDAKENMSK